MEQCVVFPKKTKSKPFLPFQHNHIVTSILNISFENHTWARPHLPKVFQDIPKHKRWWRSQPKALL
jgi:hypothetical protein